MMSLEATKTAEAIRYNRHRKKQSKAKTKTKNKKTAMSNDVQKYKGEDEQ